MKKVRNYGMPGTGKPEYKNNFQETYTGFPLKGLLLPNIALFREVNRKYDEIIYQALGFSRVLRRFFLSEEYVNRKLNVYLRRNWARLHRLAIEGDEERFYKLHNLLKKKSATMRLLFLWRTEKNWYKDLSITKIVRTIRNLDKIATRNSYKFNFRRIYIPKSSGELRPLAIPPLEWRVMTNWENIVLTIWLEPQKEKIKNFGVLRKGGTKGAWEKILENLEKKYILEFDISKFFDMIPWYHIRRNLIKYKVPIGMIEDTMNKVKWATALLKTERLEEISEIYKDLIKKRKRFLKNLIPWYKRILGVWKEPYNWYLLTYHVMRKNFILSHLEKGGKIPNQTYPNKLDWDEVKMEAKFLGEKDFWETAKEWLSNKSIHRKFRLIKLLFNFGENQKRTMREGMIKSYGWDKKPMPFIEKRKMVSFTKAFASSYTRGVPQGFGLSPILSTIALQNLYNKWEDKLIMYLDDGIIMSDSKIEILELMNDFAKHGLILDPSKTKSIKEDGIWKSNLKFLGLEYLPKEKKLKAMTRTGSETYLPDLDLSKVNLKNPKYSSAWLESIKDLPNHEKWRRIDAFGFGIALMYGTKTGTISAKIKPGSLATMLKITPDKYTTSKIVPYFMKMLATIKKLDAHQYNLLIRKLRQWERTAIKNKGKPLLLNRKSMRLLIGK